MPFFEKLHEIARFPKIRRREVTMTKEHKLRELGLKINSKQLPSVKKKLFEIFGLKNSSNKGNHQVYKLKTPISLNSWNEKIEKHFVKKYEKNIVIHVHCCGCDFCCLKCDKHKRFKRCIRCKKVYFCSPECKKKSPHKKFCKFFKGVNLDDILVKKIFCDKKTLVIHPEPMRIFTEEFSMFGEYSKLKECIIKLFE